MTKEYGKLTTNQFREVIGMLPEIRYQQAELSDVIAQMPKEKLNALLVRGYSWGEIYEHSFIEHVAIAVVAFNYADTLSAAVRTDDGMDAPNVTADQQQTKPSGTPRLNATRPGIKR